MPITPRPISITVISWYFISSSILGLLLLPWAYSIPVSAHMYDNAYLPAVVFRGINGLAGLLSFVSGYAMLKRKNWGRMLYLYSVPLNMLFTISASSPPYRALFAFGFPFYIVLAYFLLRRGASDYFHGVPAADQPAYISEVLPQTSRTSVAKQIAVVFLLGCGGIFLLFWLLMFSTLLNNFIALLIASLFFLFIAGGFVLLALWLWGWARWKILIGTLITTTAGFGFMVGIMFKLFASPDMRSLFQGNNVDLQVFNEMGGSTIVGSLFALVAGIILILIQKKDDKRARQLDSA